MTYHACVWIDQREAKIFEITSTESTKHQVTDDRPVHHLHRKADHVGLGTVQMDEAMLKAVADALGTAQGILIVGPGKAKTVLKSYLDKHTPELAERVWDVQASDHPTDAGLVATAQAYFRAADRMH